MNHKNLSVKQRYTLLFAILFFLIVMGSFLSKSWNQTPESHFLTAVNLMDKGEVQQAVNHFVISQKSSDKMIKKMSSLYLGRIYHHGTKAVPVNMNKAVFYYDQAASLGSTEALYTLALLYDAGDKIPENRDRAKDYMTKAAQTMPEAQYALAVWIERGYFGKPNLKKAVALYEKAAYAGVQNAIKSLISIYHGGFGGFPKNIEKEHYWRARLK